MRQIIIRNWDWRGFFVQVNLPFPMWQVWVTIRGVISPIWGLPNSTRKVGPLIPHIHLNPPYYSQPHPPSLFLIQDSSSIARPQSLVVPLYLSMPWWSVDTKYSIHQRLYIFPSFSWLVLATVLEGHFGSGSGSNLNRCQSGGPGCQLTWTINLGTVRW